MLLRSLWSDVLWGKDNIHIGYYPHLTDRTAVTLDFPQAAQTLTRRMIQLGDINHNSRVLDLGSGKGIVRDTTQTVPKVPFL